MAGAHGRKERSFKIHVGDWRREIRRWTRTGTEQQQTTTSFTTDDDAVVVDTSLLNH